MFRATISSVNLFTDSISTIAELIDEGLFKITKDEISLSAADRAMVAVVKFSLSAKAFDEYELEKEREIGLNIPGFLSVLKRATAQDKVTFNLADNKLQVDIRGQSRRRFIVPLIELTREEIPDIQQLEQNFTTKVQLNPEILQSGIEDAEIISDSVIFQAEPKKFLMKAEGDVSKAELELESGDSALISLTADGEVKSRYPLDYLKKMLKAARIADSVSLAFGQDYPIKLSFSAGDKASLEFVLAPRVSED